MTKSNLAVMKCMATYGIGLFPYKSAEGGVAENGNAKEQMYWEVIRLRNDLLDEVKNSGAVIDPSEYIRPDDYHTLKDAAEAAIAATLQNFPNLIEGIGIDWANRKIDVKLYT